MTCPRATAASTVRLRHTSEHFSNWPLKMMVVTQLGRLARYSAAALNQPPTRAHRFCQHDRAR
eukprot:3434393-Alexandrium_andersonii.AAC.1